MMSASPKEAAKASVAVRVISIPRHNEEQYDRGDNGKDLDIFGLAGCLRSGGGLLEVLLNLGADRGHVWRAVGSFLRGTARDQVSDGMGDAEHAQRIEVDRLIEDHVEEPLDRVAGDGLLAA